jgi:hypothetical protein
MNRHEVHSVSLLLVFVLVWLSEGWHLVVAERCVVGVAVLHGGGAGADAGDPGDAQGQGAARQAGQAHQPYPGLQHPVRTPSSIKDDYLRPS